MWHLQKTACHAFPLTTLIHRQLQIEWVFTLIVCTYPASSTWKPSFPASARWPTVVLTHPTKLAIGCQDWSQLGILSWRLHPTCSFQSSDEYHNDGLIIRTIMIISNITEKRTCWSATRLLQFRKHYTVCKTKVAPQLRANHFVNHY